MRKPRKLRLLTLLFLIVTKSIRACFPDLNFPWDEWNWFSQICFPDFYLHREDHQKLLFRLIILILAILSVKTKLTDFKAVWQTDKLGTRGGDKIFAWVRAVNKEHSKIWEWCDRKKNVTILFVFLWDYKNLKHHLQHFAAFLYVHDPWSVTVLIV